MSKYLFDFTSNFWRKEQDLRSQAGNFSQKNNSSFNQRSAVSAFSKYYFLSQVSFVHAQYVNNKSTDHRKSIYREDEAVGLLLLFCGTESDEFDGCFSCIQHWCAGQSTGWKHCAPRAQTAKHEPGTEKHTSLSGKFTDCAFMNLKQLFMLCISILVASAKPPFFLFLLQWGFE